MAPSSAITKRDFDSDFESSQSSIQMGISGMIVIAILIPILFIIVAITSFCCIRRRRRNSRDRINKEVSAASSSVPGRRGLGGSGGGHSPRPTGGWHYGPTGAYSGTTAAPASKSSHHDNLQMPPPAYNYNPDTFPKGGDHSAGGGYSGTGHSGGGLSGEGGASGGGGGGGS